MGMANFGVGLSAAVRGFSEGMQIGREINGMRDEKKVRDVTKQGMEEARTQRQGQINGLIQTQDLGGGAQQFKVGGQSFTNRGDAERAAEQQVGSTLDYFNRTIAPRIRETYIEQGNMAAAESWDKYTQNQQTQRGMKSFAQALRARAMGDDEGALKHMTDAYNNDAYYGDGYKIEGYEPIKDGDKVIGYRGKFQGPDGKTTTQDFRKGDLSALVNMGIGMLSPDQAFATTLSQQTAAEKSRAEIAAKEAERRAAVNGQIQVEGIRGANDMSLEAVRQRGRQELQSQQDNAALERTITGVQAGAAAAGDRRGAELQADTAALRGLGVQDADVRAAIQRRIAGGGSSADPGTQAWDSAQKNNPMFSTMSPEEQQATVQRDVAGRAAAAAAARGLNAGTIPGQTAAPAAPARQPVILIDPATGRTITQ